MPGPISDSYDPEFGTGTNVQAVRDAVNELYNSLSKILDNKPPIYILDLVQGKVRKQKFGRKITVTLSEWELRILRFCCERAGETI